MDLRKVAEAVNCHRLVAVIGALAAVALALLAYSRPVLGLPPLERRQPPKYESTVRLLVTEAGFPWGRSVLRFSNQQTIQGDPTRFATLAVLYAQIANSDAIQRQVSIDGVSLVDLTEKREGEVIANVVPESQFSSTPLPFVDVVARYTSPEGSRQLATSTATALRQYVRQRVAAADVPRSERVILQEIDFAKAGLPVGGSALGLPVIVFLTIGMLTLALVFVLHNLEGTRAPAVQAVGLEPGRRAAPVPVQIQEPAVEPEPEELEGGRVRSTRWQPRDEVDVAEVAETRRQRRNRAKTGGH